MLVFLNTIPPGQFFWIRAEQLAATLMEVEDEMTARYD